MIRLLYRFVEPTGGEITIGGQNIANVDLHSLRKSIAIVPQDSVLFHNTIGYNINYGSLKKNQQDVEEAAQMAEIHNSILSWPKKYDTEVCIIFKLFVN